MKTPRRRRRSVELFEASLASGIGQALAGWAAEYTHTLLERDPELRAQLRENWMRMFQRIAQLVAEERDQPGGERRGSAR